MRARQAKRVQRALAMHRSVQRLLQRWQWPAAALAMARVTTLERA